MSLEGKVAIVTGASRGIGRSIALRLAQAGALLVANYQKNADAAAAVVREIEAAGGEAFAVQADVGALEQVRHCFETVDAELNRRRGSNQLDILVNNAGIFRNGTVQATSEEVFDQIFATNVKGSFFFTRFAIPRLRDGGRVINLSSVLARRPSAQYAAYCMTKAAIETFSTVLAAELGKRGITVNSVAPGLTATDMTAELREDPETVRLLEAHTALGRVGTVEDIATVVAFLAGPEGGWVTGQSIEASGGLNLM